jgi:hypothetical protein
MMPGTACGGAASTVMAQQLMAVRATPTNAVRVCGDGIGGGAHMDYRSSW